MSSDQPLEQKNSQGVPAILYVLMVAILAGMYYYASFVLYANPETVVSTYYHSYFSGDFKTASENISVFQAAQALPQQYGYLPAASLLAERPDIEEDLAQLMEDNVDVSQLEGLSVEVIPKYTRKAEFSAIVVCKLMKDDKEMGMQAAFLDKEGNRFRILQSFPINDQILKEIQKTKMKEMDSEFKAMLTQ